MAELAQYRKLLNNQSSKHIDKYNKHKQKHTAELSKNAAKAMKIDEVNMEGVDPEVQDEFNKLVRAMATQMLHELAKDQDSNKEGSKSFTLQKFYEQNRQQMEAKHQQSGSEDFELTAGQSMEKREPVQVSSEEIDDNTELEQQKELLRNELTQEQEEDKNEKSVKSGITEDEEPPMKQ